MHSVNALMGLGMIGCCFTASVSNSQIAVPPGFAVDQLLGPIDGVTPALEAIRNPDYGFGVASATIENGILTVLRVSQSSLSILGTTVVALGSTVANVGFDTTGLFGNTLYVSVRGPGTHPTTEFFCLSANGVVASVAGPIGPSKNYTFDFNGGIAGWSPGMYLEDRHVVSGSDFDHFAPPAMGGAPCGVGSWSVLADDLKPPGRTDIDVRGMEFDETGVFDFALVMADTDTNCDHKSAIYKLDPTLSWAALYGPVSYTTRSYGDMTISAMGAFGPAGGMGPLYVTETLRQEVMHVDSFGNHVTFATGFMGIFSISASEDGNSLFVSDGNGVFRIRPDTPEPGPTLVMREPKVEPDDVHSGPSGVSTERLLFSESIVFMDDDLSVLNAWGQAVPFSASGSGSQFLAISFGEPLKNDTYTITVSDDVVGLSSGLQIDGNDDGVAGGDLVIVMKHRSCNFSRRPRTTPIVLDPPYPAR